MLKTPEFIAKSDVGPEIIRQALGHQAKRLALNSESIFPILDDNSGFIENEIAALTLEKRSSRLRNCQAKDLAKWSDHLRGEENGDTYPDCGLNCMFGNFLRKWEILIIRRVRAKSAPHRYRS